MNLWPLRGGVTPPANKAQSSAAPIRTAGIAPELIFPLTQRGADAIAVVRVGDLVRKGQLLARAGDGNGAPVHASTSGEIIALETRPIAHAQQPAGRCLVLRSDGHDAWRERTPWPDMQAHAPLEVIARIGDAGIVGAGGAGFPTARKLLDAHGAPLHIETLIINGAECEPYITADDRLLRERATEIANGIRVLQYILQPQRVQIAIEDEQHDALAAMRAAAPDNAEVVAIPSIYPTGGEAPLIAVLTGREVPSDGHPADVGAVCFNVGTVAAIARAVLHDEPMLSRIVTITGGACAQPGNFDVLIGTPLSRLLVEAGRDIAQQTTLIAGGAMMGFSLASDAVPVQKTTHCFIAGTAREFPPPPPAQACIRCGECALVCPAQLLPQQLIAYARTTNTVQLDRHHLFNCIECGACDYVCPSHIPLTAILRDAKRTHAITGFEQRQAPLAKQRFLAHQSRIARTQEEREAQRAQRLQVASAARDTNSGATLSEQDNKKAAIQAAIARAQAKKENPSRRTAVAAALGNDETPLARLQRRIAELEAAIAQADSDHRARLQRALADLHEHLAAAQADPAVESARAAIERALARGDDTKPS